MKLTIGKKITAGFLAVVLLFTCTALYTLFMVENINSNYSELIAKRVRTAILAKELKAVELEKIASFRGFIINGDTKKLERIDECEKQFAAKKTEIEKLLITTEGKSGLSSLIKANEEYGKLIEKVKILIQNNQQEEIMAIVSGEGVTVLDNVISSSDLIASTAQKLLDDGSAEQAQKSHDLIRDIILLSLFTLIISILLSFYISRKISKPIVKLSQVVDIIAQGDLTVEGIHIKNRDEVGNLANSFNKMLNNLRDVVKEVVSSSKDVATSAQELMAGSENASAASEEITAAIQNVSFNIENQKDNINNISSTMNEMSAGIEQTSANMQNVNSNTLSINRLSEKGQNSLKDVVNQMEVISKNSSDSVNSVKSLGEMSKKVADIIEIITGISSQTNLLALNAAIEAARAGEQGRGFSVVAEEVRNLAEQSNTAAVEISRTIQKMNEEIGNVVSVIEAGALEVKTGSQVVNEVTLLFQDISNGFGDIFSQVQEVSAASQEMSAGTQEVVASVDIVAETSNKNVLSVHDVVAAVEEQTATMEEIANKATFLTQLAEELDNTVKIFKVK